ERMQDAIGVVDPLEIVIHLGAERAAGERMRWVAVQLPGRTVVHVYYPTARVRTVVPASAANDLERAGRAHRAMIPSNLRLGRWSLAYRQPRLDASRRVRTPRASTWALVPHSSGRKASAGRSFASQTALRAEIPAGGGQPGFPLLMPSPSKPFMRIGQ